MNLACMAGRILVIISSKETGQMLLQTAPFLIGYLQAETVDDASCYTGLLPYFPQRGLCFRLSWFYMSFGKPAMALLLDNKNIADAGRGDGVQDGPADIFMTHGITS